MPSRIWFHSQFQLIVTSCSATRGCRPYHERQNFVIKVGSEYTINLFELDTQLEYDESTDLEYEGHERDGQGKRPL